MSLTIEEIQHYPIGPDGLIFYGSSELWRIRGFDPIGSSHESEFLILENSGGIFDGASTLEHSPVLFPLSDLTKPITIKGETFIMLENTIAYEDADFLIKTIRKGFVEMVIYNMLLKSFFDVNNLIPQGKAISVHDLDVNCYE